jgi:hypothetical protein
MNIDEIIIFQQNLYNEFLKQDLNFLKLFSKKLLIKENKDEEIVFINIIKNHIFVIEDSLNKIKEIGYILDNIKDYINKKNEDKKIINIYLECKNILNNFIEINKKSNEHYNIILNFSKNY